MNLLNFDEPISNLHVRDSTVTFELNSRYNSFHFSQFYGHRGRAAFIHFSFRSGEQVRPRESAWLFMIDGH